MSTHESFSKLNILFPLKNVGNGVKSEKGHCIREINDPYFQCVLDLCVDDEALPEWT